MTTSKCGLWLDYILDFLFIFDGLRSLSESLDLQSFGRLEELGQLVLGHVHLAGVHELQDGGQVL